MVKRKVYFTLDCAKPGNQYTVEGLHVGDKRSCEFHILLRNGIVPLSFDDENIAVIMNAQKPDGTTISTLCDISEDKKEVVYTLDVQDTTVAGIVNYELIIAAYDGENYCVLYSATFSTVVSTGVIVPVFKKLDSEPDDWATGYKKYFRHTQNGYEKITDETCPTFNSNDFYFLVNPNYDSENDYSAFEQTVANVQSLLLRVGAVEAKNEEQDTAIGGKAAIDHTHPEYVSEDELHVVIDNIEDVLGSVAIPQQYGAMGDGVTDDTAAIQAAIDDNDLIYFPQGTYIIDTSSHRAGTYGLVIPSNKTLIFDDNAVLKQKELPLFKNGSAVDYAFMLHIPNNASNVTIKGGKIIGDRIYKLETLSEIAKADCLSWYSVSQGHHMGIRLEHCSNVLIEGVTIEDMSGDGISLTANGDEFCQNVTIRNCNIKRSWRNGINVGNSHDIMIENCNIKDSGCNLLSDGNKVYRPDVLDGASGLISRKLIDSVTGELCGWMPRCGIDIETDNPVQMPTKQVHIRNCIFTGNAQSDIDICNGCDEVYVDSCYCETNIQSERKEITGLAYKPTDKIIISNTVSKGISLHGEQAVGCEFDGASSYKDGSVFTNCKIGRLDMANDPNDTITHYFLGCVIHDVNMPFQHAGKCFFQNCTFKLEYKGSRLNVYGNIIFDSCAVDITSKSRVDTTHSIINIRKLTAVNTSFTAEVIGNEESRGLFDTNAGDGTRKLILLNCIFDIPGNLRLFNFKAQITAQNSDIITICGCTLTNRASFNDAKRNGVGIVHGNVFCDQAADTLAKYGITDAYTKTEVDNLLSGKYEKPGGGIPKTDLSSEVQTSLGKADSALQSHQSLANYYNKTEANNLLSGKADTSHTHSEYLTLETLPIYNGGVQ